MRPIIFYIDDQETNLTILEASLPDDWEFHLYEDAEKAISEFEEKQPWVIISDQRMANITGVDLLSMAKETIPDAIRIIVTGYSDEDLIIESVRRAKIFDYIRKPWDADDLEHSMKRAIQQYMMAKELKKAHIIAKEAEVKHRAAEEATKQKSLFLANMSHDLRTPLNSIIGYIEMILEDLENGEALDLNQMKQELESVNASSTHLLGLIENILNLVQAETNNLIITKSTFNIKALIDDVVDMCQPLLTKHNNSLTIEDNNTPDIHADRMLVKRIIVNLLSNASKYDLDGKIVIKIDESDHNMMISVIDDGPGIEEELSKIIFNPFTKANMNQNAPVTGTGLGLNISQQLAKQMGGKITLDSKEGEGSTFTLILPK